MVGEAGFEPAISRSQSENLTGLDHPPLTYYFYFVSNSSIKVFTITPIPLLIFEFQAVPAISQWIKGKFSTNSFKKAAPLDAPI